MNERITSPAPVLRVSASVCIAAHNEVCGIETALRSALEQRHTGRLEILVCANGCRDGTAERVREIARLDPRVRLIETLKRGKPNAWNILRQNASGQILYFMDSDVFIVQGSFESLAQVLNKNPQMVAAGARSVPVNLNRGFLSRLTVTPAGPITCLHGGLYAVDACRLAECFRDRGFTRMPHDILCDDLWLTMVIGKKRWIEEPRARALHIHPLLPEQILAGQRFKWGLQQLHIEYGELDREFGDTYLRRLRRWLFQTVSVRSPLDAVRIFTGTMLLLLLVICTTGTSIHGSWLRKWRTATLSKRLVPLLPAYAVRTEGVEMKPPPKAYLRNLMSP